MVGHLNPSDISMIHHSASQHSQRLIIIMFYFVVIPRQTVFYDIVDFLYHKNMTMRLKQELPILAKSPVNADMELRHIEVHLIRKYLIQKVTIIVKLYRLGEDYNPCCHHGKLDYVSRLSPECHLHQHHK